MLKVSNIFPGQANVVAGGAPQQGRAMNNGPGPQLGVATSGGQPARPALATGATAYKYTPTIRPTQPMQGQQSAQPAVHIQGQEPLSASALAAAHPNDQKQMLGERLFPLIQVSTHCLRCSLRSGVNDYLDD